MTDIKVGDRVKVAFEGEVVYINHGGTYEVQYDGPADNDDQASADFLPASALEVIKPPIRVGDTVTKDQLNDLPIHSYVRGQAHGGHFLRTPLGAWRSAHGIFEAGLLGGPFTVLYIPED